MGESSEDDSELQESGKLNTLEMAAIREQQEAIRQIKSALNSVPEEQYDGRHH